jgi:hypothetical protein
MAIPILAAAGAAVAKTAATAGQAAVATAKVAAEAGAMAGKATGQVAATTAQATSQTAATLGEGAANTAQATLAPQAVQGGNPALLQQNVLDLKTGKILPDEMLKMLESEHLAPSWGDFRTTESMGEKPVYRLETGKDSRLLNGQLPEKSVLELDNPEGRNHLHVETNGHGRVIDIQADRLERVDGARDLNQQRRCCQIKDGRLGDDAGHGIAREFGGPREQFNLFPMNREVNRFSTCKDSGMKTFRFMEEKIEKAIDSGQSVTQYRLRPSYEGDSFRPSSFNARYYVDGRPTYFHIKNPVLAV